MKKKADTCPDSGRLLILGTQRELTGLVKKARQRGLYVCVCDAYADGPARAHADMDYVADVRDTEAVADICRREKIDHILTSFSDVMFESMVRAAEKAGLPCYMVPAMLPAYRNKAVMKTVCRRLGISVPAFLKLRKGFAEKEIRRAGISFPAVLKPADSYGSRGIHIVRTPQEIRAVFRDSACCSGDGSVLLEEWSDGQEINIHGFAADGELTVVAAGDRKTVFWREDSIPLLYGIDYPAREAGRIIPKAQELLSGYIRETGQKWGPVAMQCFWDGQNLRVCEITGRMLAFEHELIDMTTGLDTEELLLDLTYDRLAYCEKLRRFRTKAPCSGQELQHGAGPSVFKTAEKSAAEPDSSVYAEGIYIRQIRGGVIKNMNAVREISSLQGVADNLLFYREGEKAGILGPKQYFARVYVRGSSRKELREREKIILQHCHACNADGEEMLLQVDTEGNYMVRRGGVT